MHAKYSIWGNKNILRETCNIIVSELRYQNDKKHVKHHIWGMETRYPETCLLSVYERAKHQNAKKHGKLYIGIKKKSYH